MCLVCEMQKLKRQWQLIMIFQNPGSSKHLTTYQSPGQDMYQVTRPLVHLGAKIMVLHSHIPKWTEVNTFL